MSGDEPYNGGHNRNGNHRGHKHRADFICQSGDGGFGPGSVFHQGNDFCQRGFIAHLGGAEGKIAGLVHCCADDLVSRLLFHGQRFAGDGGFINRSVAVYHNAVHGNALSAPHHQNVAHGDFLCGNGDFFALPENGCGFRGQVHELFQCVLGFSFAPLFHVFSDGNQGQNGAGGFIIQSVHVGHGGFHVHVPQCGSHCQGGVQTVQQGGAGAQRNQCVHTGGEGFQRPESGNEIPPLQHQNGQHQQQLHNGGDHHIFHAGKERGQGQTHHAAHSHIHQQNEKYGGPDNPLFRIRGLVLFRFGNIRLRRRFTGQGSAVARVGHRLNDGLGIGFPVIIGNGHGVHQQIDLALLYAGNLVHGFLHVGLAGGAGHAGDVKFFCCIQMNHLGKFATAQRRLIDICQ